MIVISNHVKTIGMDYPPGSLIRINLAWAGSVNDVKAIIDGAVGHKIWLDYPTGRTKPPAPSMTLMDAINICKEFADHIEYFAFSNAEDPNIIQMIRALVPEKVKLAPKVETTFGVHHLKDIINASKADLIMLDKEDLYVDCGAKPEDFNMFVAEARKWCKENSVICLELKGVIFSHD
jgi:pyruvate kinase